MFAYLYKQIGISVTHFTCIGAIFVLFISSDCRKTGFLEQKHKWSAASCRWNMIINSNTEDLGWV